MLCDWHSPAISKYCNACCKKPYSGVCAHEYSVVIRNFCVPEGNRLYEHFACWSNCLMLQQYKACPYMTAHHSKVIDEPVPRGCFTKWPARFPDLSPIESVGSWMDMQLRKRPQCSNVEELKARLIDIGNTVPSKSL